MALLAAPASQAQFSFATNADGTTVTITGYSGAGGAVTIPSTNTSGLIVTGIGQDAFCDCTSLTNITIPMSVTNIGDGAFRFCYSLGRVYFGGNAPTLGTTVFSCDNNVTVYYPPGTTGSGVHFLRTARRCCGIQ